MTHTRKQLIVATLMAAAASFASAQPAPAPMPQMAPAAGEASAQPAPERGMRGERGMRKDPVQMQQRMAERHAKRMADLKAQLKITATQENAWNSFAAAMQPKAPAERPARSATEKLTTPQRIDRMQAMHAEHAAEMKARGDATKAFYAQLSAEQQKIFDDRAMRGPRGEGKGGRGGHPRGHGPY